MEDIKLLVQEEGRSARNLVAFNVPVIQTQFDSSPGKLMKKPPTSPRSLLDFRKDESRCKRSRDSSQSGSRVRSASTGRDKKSELHARYWAFLLGNLQRAVDEIYQTCETDESVAECKEIIMVLDNYTREFRNLINWFKIKWEYETTPPPQRPRSLAWEIRKSSPGKIRHKCLESITNTCAKTQLSCSHSSVASIYENQSQLNINKDNQIGLNEMEVNEDLKTNLFTSLQNTSNLSVVPEIKIESSKNNDVVLPNLSHSSPAGDSFETESKAKENMCDNKFPPQSDSLTEKVALNDTTMIDEICQTDPEKDVDENGPKFISSAQQTCSQLTRFSEIKMKDTESQNITTENHSLKTIPSSISRNIKSKNSDDDTKSLIKTTTVSGINKTINPTSSANVKPSHMNSYSLATTSPAKRSLTISTTATRTNSLGKLSRTNSSNKPSVTSNVKPSCRMVPVTSAFGKLQNAARLPRSQTVSEGLKMIKRGTEFNNGISKKKISPTTNVKESSKTEINYFNSNTSLNSLDSSLMKQDVNTFGQFPASKENSNEEDDGWVKVRSRSRFSPVVRVGDLETTLSRSASNLKPKGDQKISKMFHKIRYQQPSSAISLPTLTFSTSDFADIPPEKKTFKSKLTTNNKINENLKLLKKLERNKMEEINGKKKSSFEKPKRNCSRLNKTSERIEHNKMEKAENEKNLTLNTEPGEDFEKATVLYQDGIDEDENHFDEEIKKNKEKEEMLQKEINDLEAADLEVDLETGDEETDGETTTGTEEELDHEKKTNPSIVEEENSVSKKHCYETILSGISWADHMDTLDELEKLVAQDCSKKGMSKDEQMDALERLEEFVARHPGRALELHQKLSSPSRRRTMLDTVKRFQARQAKASEKREQLKMEKAQKLRELLKKVDEVKAAKDKLIEERRQRLEMKLKRAAENRNLHLKEIMRKAHDEEEKLKEIAFINELEAQNKRHDFMTQCQEQEGRLQGIHEERQRKQEEKAAKEAAFEERRKAIEAERQEKLEKMQERQRKRDEQADKKKQEKEKERQELAREKARDRSERLEALHAAQLEAQEELQKKIQQKQEDYARRHEENIEQIRQKAFELSILKCSDDIAPKLAPYEVQKLCTACNVLIGSEVYLLSHIRGKKHQETVKNQINGKDLAKEEVEHYDIKIIVNAPSDKIDPKISMDKERLKSFKKKSKKIRLRMISKGEEFMSKLDTTEKLDSPGKGKIQKCLKDIERAIKSQGKGQWSDSAITTLERSMGEISRLLNKENYQDHLAFKSLNGFGTLNSILLLDMEVPTNMTPYLPQKCFVTASSTFLAAVNHFATNCRFIILSNYIITLLDLLMKRLTVLIPEHGSMTTTHYSKSLLPFDPIASVLLRLIAEILTSGGNGEESCSAPFLQRLQDIISYTVSSGIVDKLTKYCKSVRDPVDNQPAHQFLLNILELLTTLTTRCKTVRQGEQDPTQLLATLQVTELVGAVSILYGMLLHQGSTPRLTEATPPTLPFHIIAVAVGTIRLLRSVAELDLQMFQSILGAEGISLQFRHIASYLLWYCCQDREKVLLHEVIAVVGYFAVFHRDNQMILQSGSTPTVLQQLCSLPFPYFSNPELSVLLFPTLLACCCENEENKVILEQEISYSLLEDFMESEAAKDHPLVRILSSKWKPGKS